MISLDGTDTVDMFDIYFLYESVCFGLQKCNYIFFTFGARITKLCCIILTYTNPKMQCGTDVSYLYVIYQQILNILCKAPVLTFSSLTCSLLNG